MYLTAIADSVMLYLQHDLHDIIFKMKHKLCIASGSAPPTQDISGCAHGDCCGICYEDQLKKEIVRRTEGVQKKRGFEDRNGG
jgi:hypothetical protein